MALARYSTPVSENLDLVRSIYAAQERGDSSTPSARDTVRHIRRRELRGGGTARYVGDDRVLSIQRLKGRAKLSGIEIELRYAGVNTVRDDKIVRVRECLSVAEALKAVGLI